MEGILMNSFRKMLMLMKTFCFVAVMSLVLYFVNSSNLVYAICSCPGGTCDGIIGHTINGTDNVDCIDGEGGNDTIFGYGANDALHGGPGNDEIFGGCGTDVMNGGFGANAIHKRAGDGDICNAGGFGSTCDELDTTCLLAKSDFFLKDNMRPVSTDIISKVTGEPNATNAFILASNCKVEGFKDIKPSTFITMEFALKGYSEVTGLNVIPDVSQLAYGFGNISISYDKANDGIVTVKAPAYTKEESMVVASQIFIPENEGVTMYDSNNFESTILKDIEYIRFEDTALIPVQ